MLLSYLASLERLRYHGQYGLTQSRYEIRITRNVCVDASPPLSIAIRQGVDLKTMKQFLAVAQALSFRKAAERLHISQPPLSVSIRQLETSLGVTLFERRSTGVVLTPAGITYQREAQRIVALAEQAVLRTQASARGGAGEVRIAFISSAMVQYLPKVLLDFRQSFGDISLKLVEAISVDVAEMVELGRADVGLLSPPVALSASVNQEAILSDSLVAVVPGDHAYAALPAIPLTALANEPLVSFSSVRVPSFHARIVAACLEQGFEPRVVQEATQIYTILSLVAGGLGIALLPSATASLKHPGVVYVPISNASGLLRTQIDAIYLAGEMEAATAAFLGVVRQHAQARPARKKARG